MRNSVPLMARAKDWARKAVNKFPIQPKVSSKLQNLSSEVQTLQAEVRTLQATFSQLQDVVKEMGGLLPPPRHLQVRVVGVYAPDFIESGRGVVKDMNSVLAYANENLRSFGTILDFGCGCARVLRALRSHAIPSQILYGTDIDAEAIEWCKANYPHIAEFSVNPTVPPMSYGDDMFDFIYSISIFTHLPEDMQLAWLQELHRVAKPDAYLVLTVHGKNHYHNIPPELRHVMQEKGFCYLHLGDTEGLPSFYKTAFHSHEYIRSRWSDYFDILDIQEVGISNWQDAILCRNRDGT
jgi:SAM-dependent methyltransferase